MKLLVIAKFAVWLVAFILLINSSLSMISAPSSVENVIGFFIIIATVYLSIKTKCLTNINKTRKHEE